MAEEEKVEEGAEEKEKKPKKDSNLVPLLITIIVVLVIQAVIAFAMVKISAPKVEDPEEHTVTDTSGSSDISNASIENEKIIPVEFEQVVNIAETDGMRFLKIGISLAYDEANPNNEDFEMRLLDYQIQMRSQVVQYLSSLNLEQVNDRSAQQNIRGDLLRELNRVLPLNFGEFSNVYITEFIIQ